MTRQYDNRKMVDVDSTLSMEIDPKRRRIEKTDTKNDSKVTPLSDGIPLADNPLSDNDTKAKNSVSANESDKLILETWRTNSSDIEIFRLRPYESVFSTFVKKRWLNRSILEVFSKEFLKYTEDYYRDRIESGKITVDGRSVGVDFVLGNNQKLVHRAKMEENLILGSRRGKIGDRSESPHSASTATRRPAISSFMKNFRNDLRIVSLEDDLVVVDKPSSIPVHCGGSYRWLTVVGLLQAGRYTTLEGDSTDKQRVVDDTHAIEKANCDDTDSHANATNTEDASDRHSTNSDKKGDSEINGETEGETDLDPIPGCTLCRSEPFFLSLPGSSTTTTPPACSSGDITAISPPETYPDFSSLHTVHRLDKFTSGLVLLARTQDRSRKLQQEFCQDLIQKTYLIRVEGRMSDLFLKGSESGDRLIADGSLTIVTTGGVNQTREENREAADKWIEKRNGLMSLLSSDSSIRESLGLGIDSSTFNMATDIPTLSDRAILVRGYMKCIDFRRGVNVFLGRECPEGQGEAAKPNNNPNNIPKPKNTKSNMSSDDTPKYSETFFVPLAYDEKTDTSLVIGLPRTGRTHQLRVHLQHIGHPICNDVCYSEKFKEKVAREKEAKEEEDSMGEEKKEQDENIMIDYPRLPGGHVSGIFLHAWQYEGPGWSYRTELPWWV